MGVEKWLKAIDVRHLQGNWEARETVRGFSGDWISYLLLLWELAYWMIEECCLDPFGWGYNALETQKQGLWGPILKWKQEILKNIKDYYLLSILKIRV